MHRIYRRFAGEQRDDVYHPQARGERSETAQQIIDRLRVKLGKNLGRICS